MRIFYKSRFYKLGCVSRYLILRGYYRSKFICPEWSMIGKDCGIHIFRKGNINCEGRIIVNDHVMLYAKGQIQIGRQFYINQYSRIVAHQRIEIGSQVTIGQFVTIVDHDHQFLMQEGSLNIQGQGYQTAPVRIGDNVWLGDKCTILKGVTIGNNVVVGANTLVHKDVPANSVIGGAPFKILKRF